MQSLIVALSGEFLIFLFLMKQGGKIKIIKNSLKLEFCFDFCFTALRHILGHFGRGQLT